MQADNQMQLFNFRGEPLEIVMRGSDLFVGLRRCCEALGISTEAQVAKLKNKEWAVTAMIEGTGPDGKQYLMTVIHVGSLPMWLASISSKKVAAEVRPKLLAFQKEAADVLADHFLGQRSFANMPHSYNLSASLGKIKTLEVSGAITQAEAHAARRRVAQDHSVLPVDPIHLPPKNLTHLDLAGHKLRLYSVDEPFLWISGQDFMQVLGHPKGALAQGLMPPAGEFRSIYADDKVVDLAIEPARIARHIAAETGPAVHAMRAALGVSALAIRGNTMLRRVTGLVSKQDFTYMLPSAAAAPTPESPAQSPPQSALPHLRGAASNPTLH